MQNQSKICYDENCLCRAYSPVNTTTETELNTSTSLSNCDSALDLLSEISSTTSADTRMSKPSEIMPPPSATAPKKVELDPAHNPFVKIPTTRQLRKIQKKSFYNRCAKAAREISSFSTPRLTLTVRSTTPPTLFTSLDLPNSECPNKYKTTFDLIFGDLDLQDLDLSISSALHEPERQNGHEV